MSGQDKTQMYKRKTKETRREGAGKEEEDLINKGCKLKYGAQKGLQKS